MKPLPVLLMRLVPNARCIKCGQGGYVHDRARLCCACLNMAVLLYAREYGQEKSKAKAMKASA